MMNERQLPDWITGYLRCNENSEPSTLYKTWCAVSVVAAALQRKCFLVNGDLTWYPNFYVVLIGPPASRKNTALNQAAEFLKQKSLGLKLAANSLTRERLIRDLRNCGKDSPHSSLTIFNKELSVFLGFKNLALILDLIDWYDCDNDWAYGTKHGDDPTDIIYNVWVNILGGATPEALEQSIPFDASGIGLFSRIIFVYAHKKENSIAVPSKDRIAKEIEFKLRHDIERIAILKGAFQMTPECVAEYALWYMTMDENITIRDHRFQEYYGRKQVTVCKLAMVFCAARTDDMEINVDDLHRALDLLQRTERLMPHAIGGLGKNKMAPLIPKLMADIRLGKEVLLSDLIERYIRDVMPEELHTLLSALEKIKFCRIMPESGKIVYTPQRRDTSDD